MQLVVSVRLKNSAGEFGPCAHSMLQSCKVLAANSGDAVCAGMCNLGRCNLHNSVQIGLILRVQASFQHGPWLGKVDSAPE